MYRIIKIGMDVHSKNYTLCAMEPTIGGRYGNLSMLGIHDSANPNVE